MTVEVLKDWGIRHISFDFWNTLAVANPDYTKVRSNMLSMYALDNGGDLTPAEAASVYTTIKRILDNLAEYSGQSITTPNAIRYLLNSMDLVNVSPAKMENLVAVINSRFQDEFLAHPPIVLDETKKTLKKLTELGFTVSIGSNTNFISGNTLSKLVDRWGVDWKFTIFSDLGAHSKPHPNFFRSIQHKSGVVFSQHIMHVGDHKVCDGNATNFGLAFMHVENPLDLVQKFKLV